VIRADSVDTADDGQIMAVYCTYDPETLGANPADGRKVKGVIHWVDASTALDCSVHLYDRLFTEAEPDRGDHDFIDYLNPASLQIMDGCKAESSLADSMPGHAYQFEREGYFCRDAGANSNTLVFNRTISLRDSWGEGKGS